MRHTDVTAHAKNRWIHRSSLALCVMLALAAAGAHAGALSADDWPQFRGNLQLTGVAEGSLPEQLELIWSFEAGEAIESSAAILDGTVFVGTLAGELLALDLATGRERWRYTTGEPIGESSPAAGRGLVFVGDLGGVLHAVRIEDGSAAWTFETQGEIKSSPVLVGGTVIVGSYDAHLYGLGAADGRLAWKVRFEGYLHGTPAVLDDVAYIGGCDETFRGIRVKDGTEVFSVVTGAYTGASPALVGGAACFGTFSNEVISIDLASREPRWRYEHPIRKFPFYSSAAAHAGRIVLGGRDKLLHGIDLSTGRAAWTFETRARVESSPAIAGDRVYVGSNDGRLYVLDLQTGRQVWAFDAGAPLSASPAIADGRLVIGSQDGVLYCFG